MHHPSSTMTRCLKYRLETIGGNIDTLLDSGAELSMISAEAVQRRAILTEPLEEPLDIVCADQSKVQATRCVPSLPLSRGSWSDVLQCIVVPKLSTPLFLGQDWLARWNPIVDWVTGKLSLANVGEPWLPKGDAPLYPGLPLASEIRMEEMTPSAFRKWWRVSNRQPSRDHPPPCLVFLHATHMTSAQTAGVTSSSSPSDPILLPQVKKLMGEFPRVFEEATGVEPDPPVKHPIRLQDGAKPSHVKPYRFSESQKNEMKEQVSVLLHKGWIRPSSSLWGAPVLLVPKKDGT